MQSDIYVDNFTVQSEQPAGLHVAIIMDGNGRWAARRNLPRWQAIVPVSRRYGALSSTLPCGHRAPDRLRVFI